MRETATRLEGGSPDGARDVADRQREEQALRTSEARYARLAATVPGVLYEFARYPDGSARFTYLSPRCSEVFEVDCQEILDDMGVFWNMVHPEDRRALERAERESLAANRCRTPFGAEVRIATPSGRQKWLSLSSLPCPTAPGEPATCSGLILDVTERKRTEEALRDSDEWLKLTIEATGAGILQTVPYAPAMLSPSCRRMFGIPDDLVVDYEAFLRLIHPDDRDKVGESHERALDPSGEGRMDDEFRVLRPDGDARWIALKAKAQFAEVEGARRAVRLAAVTLDVTDGKREEEALRESEERFRALADNIPQHAYMADAKGRIFWLNRRTLDFTGGKGMGREHLRIVHPDHLGRTSDHLERCLETGETFEETLPLRGKDGRYRWFLCRAVALRDRAGTVVRWFGTNTDVTELREAQEALREADQRKSQFLAVLSHELRNPLAPIRNSLYLLAHAAPGGDQAARARDVIDRQTQQLTRLVDDLLDVTRISHGKIELHRERLDLREVVRRTCDDHRSLFEQRGVSLRFEDPGPVWVEADPTRMSQVIGNLLQNSAKFTPQGGTTWVTLGFEGGQAAVRIRDDGAGMRPDEVRGMFEPFAQADSSLAHPHGGLGLGLALVKGLMELHGGSVTGRSTGLGNGSEFAITLPLAAPAPAARTEPLPPPSPSGQLVLIIEDNLDAGQTLAEVLEVSGYRVRVALDGQSGIAAARQLAPDVVLCDIGLPDLDGYAVARSLRADSSLGSTRLIALTGYALPEDRARAREAGFDAYLAKPAPLDELKRLIAGRT